jgi:nicotinamidase-related amidase
MATLRDGNNPVLLVVDVQVGVMNDAWDAPRVIAKVARAVERARAENVPVIWIQHEDEELVSGSDEWRWVPELVPMSGEAQFRKRFNSSFEQTKLDDELEKLQATHIVLAGAATNWCIRATAFGALERGYDLTLVNDAHTTGPMTMEDGTIIEAANVIRELNTAMTWLSYPDRSNGTAAAEEVDFLKPANARNDL